MIFTVSFLPAGEISHAVNVASMQFHVVWVNMCCMDTTMEPDQQVAESWQFGKIQYWHPPGISDIQRGAGREFQCDAEYCKDSSVSYGDWNWVLY